MHAWTIGNAKQSPRNNPGELLGTQVITTGSQILYNAGRQIQDNPYTGVSMMARNVQPSRLGAVIAAKRKLMGLSQRQLAERTGINNATISKLEKDPSLDPDISTIRSLAQSLELDYTYLLSLNETIPDDPDMRIIARAKSNMSPDQQKEMMAMLRTAFDVAFANAESDGIDEADVF